MTRSFCRTVYIITQHIPFWISAILETTLGLRILPRKRTGIQCRPGLTTADAVTAVIEIQTVGLHQTRQSGVMRLVTLGAAVGVFPVVPPPFYRLMDPQTGPELTPPHAVQVLFPVTARAQPGKLTLILRQPQRSTKGCPVKIVVGYRLRRIRVPADRSAPLQC